MFNSNAPYPAEIDLLRRLFVPALVLVSALYLLLTIAPFYMLGLHLQPAHLVTGGYFDPKGLPGLHHAVYMASLLLIVIAPIIIALMAPLLLVYSWRRWASIPARDRVFIASVAASSLALLVFMFTSPLARLIMVWWLD